MDPASLGRLSVKTANPLAAAGRALGRVVRTPARLGSSLMPPPPSGGVSREMISLAQRGMSPVDLYRGTANARLGMMERLRSLGGQVPSPSIAQARAFAMARARANELARTRARMTSPSGALATGQTTLFPKSALALLRGQ